MSSHWLNSFQVRFLTGIVVIILPLLTVAFLGLLIFVGTLNATKDTVDEIIAGGLPIAELSSHLQSLPLRLTDIVNNDSIDQTQEKEKLLNTIDALLSDLLSSTSHSGAGRHLLSIIQTEWSVVKNKILTTNLNDKTLVRDIGFQILEIAEKLGLYQHRLHTELKTDIFKVFKSKNEVLFLITMISLFGILLALTVAMILNRTVIHPIKNIMVCVSHLGLGEMTARIDNTHTGDIGELSETINRLAEMLENTYSHIKNQTSYDNLTGLLNRREFTHRLNTEIERARRYSQTFALLMLDINDFKAINTLYGHLAGDETLRVVGLTLSKEIRPMDTLARFSSDNFIIIMPDIAVEHAFSIAKRIRNIIANQTIFLRDNEKIRLNMSPGIAIYPDDSDNPDTLLQIVENDLKKNNTREAKVISKSLNELEEDTDDELE